MEKIYVDLKMNMLPHPVTGDVLCVSDEQAISQSIRNLLSTNQYDVPFKPWAGANIKALLFEPVSPITAHALEKSITDTITTQEPRVNLTEVSVDYNEQHNSYDIVVYYKIIALNLSSSTKVILKRAR